MKLFQAKTVGHQRLKDSGWYTMIKQLTVIEGRNGLGKTTLLRTLQAINPGPGAINLEPFRDYPGEVEKHGRRRRVIPEKKTGVFAIFICNEKLRRELTPIDPVFYKTDRIEVGRRLDWSRWINFVEIAASSRWSDVLPDLECLGDLLKESSGASQLINEYKDIQEIEPTRRVKEELADRLNNWLDRAGPQLPEKGRRCLEQARFKVNRAARFKNAREVTAENLPVLVYFNDSFLVTENPGRLSLFLGLEQQDLQGNGIPEDKKEKADFRLGELSDLINSVDKDLKINLEIDYDKAPLRLKIIKAGAKELELKNGGADLVWLVSLLIHFKNTAETGIDNTVFLLDEPGHSLLTSQRELLRPVIEKLMSRFQLIMTCQPGDPLSRGLSANWFSLVDKEGQSRLEKIT